MILQNSTNSLDSSIGIVNTLIDNGIITDKVTQIINIDDNEVELDLPITDQLLDVLAQYPNFKVLEQMEVNVDGAPIEEINNGDPEIVPVVEAPVAVENGVPVIENPVVETVEEPVIPEVSQEELYDEAKSAIVSVPVVVAEDDMGDQPKDIVDSLQGKIEYFNIPKITSASENAKEVVDENEDDKTQLTMSKIEKKGVSRKQFNEETEGIAPEGMKPEVEATEEENLDDRDKIATGQGLSSVSGKISAFAKHLKRKSFAEEFGSDKLDEVVEDIKSLMENYSDVDEKVSEIVGAGASVAEEVAKDVDEAKDVVAEGPESTAVKETKEFAENEADAEKEAKKEDEGSAEEDDKDKTDEREGEELDKKEDENEDIPMFSDDEITEAEAQVEKADGDDDKEDVVIEEFSKRTNKLFSAAFRKDSVTETKAEMILAAGRRTKMN